MERLEHVTEMKATLKATLAGVLALCVTCAAADETVGFVKRAQGTVTIERDGATLPAKAGAPLQRGDRILTEPNAHAEVRLRGASPLRIGPNATVAVDRFVAPETATSGNPIPRFFQGLASLIAGSSRY
jgi:hypothetical protein